MTKCSLSMMSCPWGYYCNSDNVCTQMDPGGFRSSLSSCQKSSETLTFCKHACFESKRLLKNKKYSGTSAMKINIGYTISTITEILSLISYRSDLGSNHAYLQNFKVSFCTIENMLCSVCSILQLLYLTV